MENLEPDHDCDSNGDGNDDDTGKTFRILQEVAAYLVVVVVLLSNVDIGDHRCPIHGEDTVFTQTLITKIILNQRHNYFDFQCMIYCKTLIFGCP